MELITQETVAEISPAGTQVVAKVFGFKPLFNRCVSAALLAGWALAGRRHGLLGPKRKVQARPRFGNDPA
jgi:hypothetical protein